MRQRLNRNFFGAADVHDFADRLRGRYETQHGLDTIAYIAKAARLFASSVHGDGLASEGLPDEIRKYHAVAASLARPNGVEKSRDDHWQFLFLPEGKRQEFIEGLGGGVTPAAFAGRTEDQIGVLVGGNFVALAIDFGSGGGEDQLFLFGSRVQHVLGAMDIGFDGAYWALHNQAHAHGGGQVENHVTLVDQFRQQMFVHDRIKNIVEAFVVLQVADIFDAARGKIVQDENFFAASD